MTSFSIWFLFLFSFFQPQFHFRKRSSSFNGLSQLNNSFLSLFSRNFMQTVTTNIIIIKCSKPHCYKVSIVFLSHWENYNKLSTNQNPSQQLKHSQRISNWFPMCEFEKCINKKLCFYTKWTNKHAKRIHIFHAPNINEMHIEHFIIPPKWAYHSSHVYLHIPLYIFWRMCQFWDRNIGLAWIKADALRWMA